LFKRMMMRGSNMPPSSLAKSLSLILFVVFVGACCSAQQAPSPKSAGNEVVTEPHGPVTIAPVLGNDAVAPEPLPTTFDCSAPPPLTPCCRALLPKCTQCAERNRAIEEAYRAQCGPR